MNSKVDIKVVQSGRDRRRFIDLPWMIYKNDPNWIPPLLSDMRNTLNPRKNALLRLGPNRLYIALRDGVTIGRLGVGMDNRLNEAKKQKLAYITLFESIEDYNVASALLDTGISWLREQGSETVTGPQSPSNGDDYRGLLIDGFSTPPVLLNSYNPPYYADFFERYGFTKQFDRYAYYYDLTIDPLVRLGRGVALAKKRYGFKERVLDMKKLDREMKVIKEVVELSMPDWPDMIPPGQDEIEAEVAKLKQLAIPELVMFVENSAGDCLGFAVALPDYNQVLARLNGRLFPVGFLKYLWYRRRITGVRMFALFVTPQGRRRGVSAALYYYTMRNAQRLGYTYGEGSTIHEFNVRMNLDARKAGGKLYKVYRVYHMPL
ncbi:MAG: GNAT family N-acetyltransferase [Dethiobacteria bacterium]|nr:GNAT family N-acetyltransferase [Dethiobacteria bacterium]